MPEVTAQTEPQVIDLALFTEPQRTVQALRNCAIVPNDQAQSDIQLLKRINHALFADHKEMPADLQESLAGMRNEFKQKLVAKPYAQLVQDGDVNKLLDDYLGVLVAGARKQRTHLESETLTGEEKNPSAYNELIKKADAKLTKYIGERGYYERTPAMIKDVAGRFENVVKHPAYLGIGKIAAMSNLCGADQAAVADLVNDVLGVQAARGMLRTLKTFADDQAMAAYANDSQNNAVRIQALAKRVADATAPLNSLREFQAEAPELDRIRALTTLTSVQLHHAMTQDRNPDQLIAVEKNAREKVRETAQAALSLAYHFLDTGPSAQDKRTRAVQANLKKEMDAAGVALLSSEEASAKASAIARQSAEDLLQAAHDHPDMAGKIGALAKAAGAEQPFAAKPQLIGEDLIELIRAHLKQGNLIFPSAEKWTSFVRQEIGATAGASPAR